MTTPTNAPAEDINTLRATITDIDAFSQEGFSVIAAIARLALLALEHPQGHCHSVDIASALLAIRDKAVDTQNCINVTAEEADCNYVDPARGRRYESARAAREQETQP